MKKYQIIYADPPWRFKYQSEVNKTNRYNRVEAHYPVMELEDIKNLPIADLAGKDSVLFLWATYPLLDKAFEVMKEWGFKYKTCGFTWVKTNKDGTPFRGMGYWTMANAELCLIASKGHPHRIRKDIPQIILSQKEKHSKKPDAVRQRIVELMGDVPRIELFAREKTDGWDVWGNEVESDISLTAQLKGNEKEV